MTDWRASGVAASAVVAALLTAGPAWADAIDGNWCIGDGRRMSIEGPQIVTPGGKRMMGDYDRHAFAYTAPKGEPDAGALISMVLIDDDTLVVSTGPGTAAPNQAPVRTWHRCGPPVS